jgi:hypothetical protein
VLKLSFPYDPALITLLKSLFAKYKAAALDPAAHREAAGGWLPREKCWFAEPCIWQELRAELETAGYSIQETSS